MTTDDILEGPGKELSVEEIVRSIARFRDASFSQFLVYALTVASETHPEELRYALGHVFDTKALEGEWKRIGGLMASMEAKANDVRELYNALQADLKALEQRFDNLNEYLECQRQKLHSNGKGARK